MTKELKKGDKVKASIMRTGGSILEVVGVVESFENAFGREDVLISKGKIEPFVVNIKNVEVVAND